MPGPLFPFSAAASPRDRPPLESCSHHPFYGQGADHPLCQFPSIARRRKREHHHPPDRRMQDGLDRLGEALVVRLTTSRTRRATAADTTSAILQGRRFGRLAERLQPVEASPLAVASTGRPLIADPRQPPSPGGPFPLRALSGQASRPRQFMPGMASAALRSDATEPLLPPPLSPSGTRSSQGRLTALPDPRSRVSSPLSEPDAT